MSTKSTESTKLTDLKQLRAALTENLCHHLRAIIPRGSFKDVYEYAVLPPGKLMRPLLVKAVESDFTGRPFHSEWNLTANHSYLASAIELHHAYTLLHDDLPCMDNDYVRRGKASTHVVYGEWSALLAGDGLLNASYHLLSKIAAPNREDMTALLRFISWCLGPKGLIQGQALDLSAKGRNTPHSFCELLQIHEYKTARLMQAALVGSFILLEVPSSPYTPTSTTSSAYQPYRIRLDLFKTGYHLGVIFQLLDDLADLAEQKDSDHEKEVNIFNYHPAHSFTQLENSLSSLEKLISKHKMNSLKYVIQDYLRQVIEKLNLHRDIIREKTQCNHHHLIRILSTLTAI